MYVRVCGVTPLYRGGGGRSELCAPTQEMCKHIGAHHLRSLGKFKQSLVQRYIFVGLVFAKQFTDSSHYLIG